VNWMYINGLGSCLMLSFGISSVESSVPVTRESFSSLVS
jgi:hypothetical protein